MRARITLTLQYLRMLWAVLSSEQKRRWKLLLPLFPAVWWVGAFDAARNVASFATYPLPARLLLALSMGPSGSMWGGLKAMGMLVDAADAPNMAWLVVIPWPPALILLTLLFVARASLELERQRLQVAEMLSRRPTPDSGRFRPGRKHKKGGYR